MPAAAGPPQNPLSPIRSIRDNTFTILGTGDIGSHVASSLKGLGAAKVTGLRRKRVLLQSRLG